MILDIQSLAAQYISDISSEVKKLSVVPKLVVIMVGNTHASAVYVRNKIRKCSEVGMRGEVLHFDVAISQDDLIRKIQNLNDDNFVDGILVQSPLPSHIHAQTVFDMIHPLKDVDGFSAANITKLYSGDEAGLVPCTPKGIIKIIEWYYAQIQNKQYALYSDGDLAGKKVVVIGKSTIVGKPLTMMLLNAGATVTVCHSRTHNLAEHTLGADIVIPAVGKKHLITADMISVNTLVIDVGICVEETDDKRLLFGDCDTAAISEKSDITPVPGGVGPMTIAMLLANTLLAHSLQGKK